MNKRVLVISPHFPPINAPDHQRIRMSLPYLREFGWDPHILAVAPQFVNSVQDSLLERTIPSEIPITRVSAYSEKLTRLIGLGNVGWRALRQLGRAGERLIEEWKPDLVYFSTTMFRVFTLGPRWRKRYGIPYIVDYQDPWISDYYQREGIGTPPPGGRLKHAFSQWTAKIFEPQVMEHVSAVTAVSPAYVETLRKNYPSLDHEQFLLLPFAANELDFEFLEASQVKQNFFSAHDGKEHWVYLGRAAGDMLFVLRALFAALSDLKKSEPERFARVHLHFVGTSYAPEGKVAGITESLAREFQLESSIHEQVGRVPYFTGLRLLSDATRIMLVGSDDKDYSPSKVYPCLLAGKPIFAFLYEQSYAAQVLSEHSNASLLTFCSDDSEQSLKKRIHELLSRIDNEPETLELKSSFLEEHSARTMTQRLCALFDLVCS